MNTSACRLTFSLLLGACCLASFNSARGETILFLATPDPELYPPFAPDSAIIPLSHPDKIAHARELIVTGPNPGGEPNQPVVAGYIASGRDGINRDLLSPNKHEWSWHFIIGVVSFADAFVIEWDGWPTKIENNLNYYFDNTGGGVALGWHIISAELGPALELSIQQATDGMKLSWPDVSTNAVYTVASTDLVYTLEAKEALDNSQWQPVPGVNWPTKSRELIVPSDATSTRFYRVRVEPAPQ